MRIQYPYREDDEVQSQYELDEAMNKHCNDYVERHLQSRFTNLTEVEFRDFLEESDELIEDIVIALRGVKTEKSLIEFDENRMLGIGFDIEGALKHYLVDDLRDEAMQTYGDET